MAVGERGSCLFELLEFTGTEAAANLAAEEWLAREHGAEQPPLAIVYRNASAVILGRNQNPWRECDPRRLRQMGVPLLRRVSGGGTVYHDLGNLNYALVTARAAYAPERHSELLREALERLGVAAERGPRNDIWAAGAKVSGTAFMLTARVALHHGTLLLDADLARLRQALAPAAMEIETKAVGSVRSPVANLAEQHPGLTAAAVVDSLQAVLERQWGRGRRRQLDTTPAALPAGAVDLLGKYTDDAWTLGRTPAFTCRRRREDGSVLALRVVAGRVEEAWLERDGQRCPAPATGRNKWLNRPFTGEFGG